MKEYRVDIVVEFDANDKAYIDICDAVHSAVKGLCASTTYIAGEGKNKITFFSLPQKNIYLNKSEEEFSESIAKRIWKANKGYCKVEVYLQHYPKLPKEKAIKFNKPKYNKMVSKRSDSV